MKYIKNFEKVKRTFNVGDVVVWNNITPIMISTKFKVAPYSKNTEYGDLCEVSEVKGEKGKLYVKLYNKDKNVYVNKFLDASGTQVAPFNLYGHWIEADNWYITKPENFNWTIFTAIQANRTDIVKKLVKNIDNINKKGGKNNDYTPLLLAGFINNLEIIEILIEAGADWNKTYTDTEKDFFYFMNDENKKTIVEKYPKEYEKYLIKKDSDKYNL